ncbi:TetR family transcriptional regulator [Streptomyces sp. TRM43335]|uniref:TetR family transcriptional regulator n=1 Tax=Streptomyces taklimakanensis TaxID=2569853 RepID=A0A6G2B922_9ACTN|nr:TetR/AcrR family transcriptional regulator [Streptomyces taklimakanensis]MTE18775.1 TetR family transcriptional regulator [Streptomyces taklimakanensis]
MTGVEVEGTDGGGNGGGNGGGKGSVPETGAARAARGRPRSVAADRAIVEAVLRLLERGVGVDALSMEGIAREAGVGKATVYRRWPGKDALLLEVMRTLDEPPIVPRGESVRDDLVEILEQLRRRGLAKRNSALLRAMMGHFHSHPELWREYHDSTIRARRDLLHSVLRRGMAAGEIRTDLDVELLGELFVGPMLSRAMLHEWKALPPGLAEDIVDGVLDGARPR